MAGSVVRALTPLNPPVKILDDTRGGRGSVKDVSGAVSLGVRTELQIIQPGDRCIARTNRRERTMLGKKLAGALLAALLLAAVGGFTASSASAVVFTLTLTPCEGGSNVALCWQNEVKAFELTGEQSETVAGGKVIFTVNSSPVQKIECSSSTGSGIISQKEPLVTGKKTTLKGTLTYEGCKLITEPSKKCVVNVTNTTKALLGTLETVKTLKLVPETGTVFIEITYSNNGTETCPVTFKGTHAVTGSQTVEILSPETFTATKSGKAIGETLEFFSSKANLSQELTMSFTGLEDLIGVSSVA
jgi:hypothetical protein